MGTGKWAAKRDPGELIPAQGAARVPFKPEAKDSEGKTRVDIRGLALAVLAGVLFVCARAELPPLWIFLPPLLLCLWPLPGRAYMLAIIAMAACTTLLGGYLLDLRLLPAQDNTRIWLQGTIEGLPESGADRTRFVLRTDTRPRRVRVSWYNDVPPLQPGQCWRLKLKLNAPHGASNPGGFDYETWLWRKRIGATGYVRAAEPCADGRAAPLDRWRQRGVRVIEDALDGHPMTGVILALSLGARDAISDAQWQVFRHTGTSHLVAISGLHIGLIAGLVFFGLRRLAPWLSWNMLRTRRAEQRLPAVIVAAGCAALAAAVYAALAGFALPTQRALVMLLVVLGAVILRRRSAPSHLLALAALAVLIIDPFAVLAPGFWLSFAAVAWILYLVTARVGKRRWYAWLALQPALVLALAPLTLFWFGEASVAAPLANAVLIPLFTLVVPAVLAAVGLTLWLPAIGVPAIELLADALAPGWAALQFLAQLPAAHFALPQPSPWAAVIATAGIALLLAPRPVPARWLGLLALLPLLFAPAPPPANGFRLALLDVGQGLSAVVRTAGHLLLFDAGPRYRTGFNAGEALVVPYMRSQGISRIDRLIISHGDIDHRGGQDAVQALMPISSASPCRASENWRWDGVDFRVLHPDNTGWTGNNASCVLKVSIPAASLLLTGDIEASAEAYLGAREDLRADVLIVPHHGSNTSSSAAFIRAVAPEYALIPAGWNNRWGFPRPQVLARYHAAGTSTLGTAESGAIRIEFDPAQGVGAPQVWREQQRRFWHWRRQ